MALSLIQQILLDLYRQQPENFCALQVEYKPLQPVQDILIGFTLHLPKPNVILQKNVILQNSEQTLDSAVTESIKSSEWLRLELILVRYAAARVTNLRMQVGPGELAINAIDEDGVQWKSAMQQVWEHNQERTFDAYLDQVSGHQTMQEAIRPTLCKQKGDWYVCADIGGTSVKGVFGNFKAGKEYPFSFATAPQGGEVYREVDLFVERFAQAFYTETGQTVESIRFRYMVLGWPGAVYKAYTESATPSGYSGILRLFGLSPSIVENTAPLIRNLRLREAFEKRFNCSVLLGNDGDQHTIAPAQLVKTSMHYRRLLVCAVGTGLGGGIIVEGDKLPLPILSEFGKCIVNIACPFPTQGNFPEGHANSLLSSNTVAHLAKTMDWTDGPTTPLELAFALSTSSSHEEYPDIEQLMRSEIEDKMRPLGVFSTPPYVNTMHDMRKKQLSGTTTDAKTEKLVEDYAQIIADITSMLHKDLICDALALTGGPMQGTMGALLVETVKDHMQKYYAIKPRGSEAKSIKPNEIHLFQSNAATPSAMHKFAEDFLPIKTNPMFSHCSLLDISGAKAEVFCPGQQQLANTYGYVRSALRAKWAGDENKTRPWRDYDTKALTPATQLFTDAAAEHVLVVGARNVGNEYGYCLRLNGNWIGRKNDKPLPEDWPVAHFHQGSIHFCEYKQRAQLPGNILTGVPLVHKNQPINYEQVLAWSSDMAHVFAVHPKGLLGPSPEAWAILSDLWEEAKQSVSEAEQIRKINDQAKALGVVPSQHLLHSVLVQYEDQRMGLAAITGGYPAIGKQLVDLGVSQAIVLDNGGSVGWWYRNQPNTEPFLLLAGPNYRPKGTVFFRVEMNSFPQPLQHPMLLKIIN